MPNISKTSRSYQLAEGQMSVMLAVSGDLASKGHFQPQPSRPIKGEQAVDQGIVGIGLPVAAAGLIDGRQIFQPSVTRCGIVLEIVQDVFDLVRVTAGSAYPMCARPAATASPKRARSSSCRPCSPAVSRCARRAASTCRPTAVLENRRHHRLPRTAVPSIPGPRGSRVLVTPSSSTGAWVPWEPPSR